MKILSRKNINVFTYAFILLDLVPTPSKVTKPEISKITCTQSNYYAYAAFKNIPISGIKVSWGIWNRSAKKYDEKHYKKIYPWTINYIDTWNGDFNSNYIKKGSYIIIKISSPIKATKIKRC